MVLRPVAALVSAALLAAGAVPVLAQSTSATIRGIVKDDTGPMPGASIVARETASGFSFDATTDADGSFTLAGLRPGTYDITVTMSQYKPAARRLQVLVGQNIDLDFRLTPDLVYAENVTVIGELAIDIRSSMIATNITAEQIRDLPQNDRNFLNFAALAPGVRVNVGSETTKEVTAGALPGFNTNVFIDGVSYKNDVLLGGVVGQDSSRGNPFPQNAVQEFRVLTQNFKAEFEKASSAAITAVTKSGGNTWTGDAFLLYQDKHLVAQDIFAEERGEEKPTYERFQGGFSLGGPIITDKMSFFGSYEINRQNRDKSVFYGGSPTRPAQDLSGYLGTFDSPFRSHLGFAKVSYQPSAGQALDLSYSLRHETEIKDFGDQRSEESAADFGTDVNTVTLRHLATRSSWINEASLTFQRFEWATRAAERRPDRPGLPGRVADRRRRYRAALHPGPARAAGRSQPFLPMEGESLRQGRHRAQPDEVRRHQVLHRQSGLPLPVDRRASHSRSRPSTGPAIPRWTRTIRSSASTSRTIGAPPGA